LHPAIATGTATAPVAISLSDFLLSIIDTPTP
jgi:hypothetical protein